MFRLIAFLAVLLAAMPAAAQRQVENPPKIWARGDVGVTFPDAIGEWQRGRIVVYDDAGTDTSVGYDLIRGGRKLATVTIYIYPPFPIGGCDVQFADSKRSILGGRVYQNAQLLDETIAASPSGARPGVAKYARFTMEAKFDGTAAVKMRSDSYMFCTSSNKWIVALRGSWPKGESGIEQDMDRLRRAITWPEALDR